MQSVFNGAISFVSSIISDRRRKAIDHATSDGATKRQKKTHFTIDPSSVIPTLDRIPSRTTTTHRFVIDPSSVIPIRTTVSFSDVASTASSEQPSFGPSEQPSFGPSEEPSFGPSEQPLFEPSEGPSFGPSVDDGSEASSKFDEDNLSDNNELSVEEKLEEIYCTLVELGGKEGDDILVKAQAQFERVKRIMTDCPHLKYNNRFVLALAVLCKSNDRSIRRGAEQMLLTIDSQFIECAHKMISLIHLGIITVADGE